MTTLMSQVYNNRDLCDIPGKSKKKKSNLGENTDTASYSILLHISLTLVSVRCFLIYLPGLSNTNAILKNTTVSRSYIGRSQKTM